MVMYVGQTQRPLSRRLAEHKGAASRGESSAPICEWLLSHIDDVSIVLLENDCGIDGEEEKSWIAFYRTVNDMLLNVGDGGEGLGAGYKLSLHTVEKMRKPKTPETRKKMSLAQIGNTKSVGTANRKAVLDESDIIAIRKMAENGVSLSDIAEEYGVQKAAIWKIKERRTWKHVA